MTVLSESNPIARNEHTCYWCGEKILPGERYTRWASIDFGEFFFTKVHRECADAWHSLHPDDFVDEHGQCRGCICERGDCRCGRSK